MAPGEIARATAQCDKARRALRGETGVAKLPIEDLPSAFEVLNRNQRAYFRLSIEISVATSLLAIYAVQQFQLEDKRSLLLLCAMLAGHALHLVKLSRIPKLITGGLTIAASATSFVFDPSGVSFVGLLGGAFSGFMHLASPQLGDATPFAALLRRMALVRALQGMDAFLVATGWKRGGPWHLSWTEGLTAIEEARRLTFERGGHWLISADREIAITWDQPPTGFHLKLPDNTESAIERAELRAIDDVVRYHGEMYQHYLALGQRAALPLQLVDQLSAQSRTLMDKYRNPEGYLDNAAEPREDDLVSRVLSVYRDLPTPPKPRGAELQQWLLLLHELKRDPSGLATSRHLKTSQWKEFDAARTRLLASPAMPDYAEDCRAVWEEIDRLLAELPR